MQTQTSKVFEVKCEDRVVVFDKKTNKKVGEYRIKKNKK